MDNSNRQVESDADIGPAERPNDHWLAFIENSTDAFIEGEVSGKILFVNDAACRLFGYDRASLLSMRVDDLLAYDEDQRRARRRELLEKKYAVNPLVKYLPRNGETRIAHVTTQLIRGHAGSYSNFQAIVRDVTAQYHTLEILKQRNEELAALNAIAQILNNPLELHAALERVCEQITSITGMESTVVYFIDESRQFLNMVAHCGMSAALISEMRQVGLDDALTRSITEGATLAIDDASTFLGNGLAGPRSEGYHAMIIVPIYAGEKSVGVIGAGSKIKLQYGESDVGLLLNIGRQIGKAWENAKLYLAMQKHMEELDVLAQLSAACATSLDPVELGKIVVAWTAKLVPVDFANFRLLEGNSLRLIASQSNARLVFRNTVPVDEFVRQHVDKHLPVVVNDIETDAVSKEFRDNANAIGIRSNCVIPLIVRSHMVGTISIGHVQPHHWESGQVDLVQTIANQVAGAIDSAQLFQKVVSEQRKIQAIFDSGLSGLFATDATGRIIMFNRVAERTTDWGLSEVQGKRWQDVFADPAKQPPPESLIDFVLEHKAPRYVHDGRWLRTHDGRVIPVAEAVAPLLDEQGNVTGAVGAFFDLSRERAAEIEREEFFREVAHQLRSPLTSMLSAMQLLDRTNLSPVRRAEMWGILKSEGERLKQFADQFLDLEAIIKSQRPLHLERLPLAAIARALVRKFRVAQGNPRILVRVSQRNLIAVADRSRVENILRNLLDNAVSYSQPGTRITIALKPVPDKLILVSVQDQGPGVPPEEREKIFEPFYRSARKEGHRVYGHGLGLAIAKRNVTEMGGTIWLDSRANRGATFYFTLRRYR